MKKSIPVSPLMSLGEFAKIAEKGDEILLGADRNHGEPVYTVRSVEQGGIIVSRGESKIFWNNEKAILQIVGGVALFQ